MLKRICFLLLTGCMTNNSLTMLSQSQENIWNLSLLAIGMCEDEVLQIMSRPYKTQKIDCQDRQYVVWFYVTKPSVLGQKRLVRQNVTPVTFCDGVLQGWGFEFYDKISQKKTVSQGNGGQKKPTHEDRRIENVIQELQKKPKTSQNKEVIDSSQSEKNLEDSENEGSESEKPEKSPLNADDEKMIEDQNDENFNFW